MIAAAALCISGCGADLAADSGQCRMQALQARLTTQLQQVEFVDACMAARGYGVKGTFSDALCDTGFGFRIDRCYVRPSVLERVKAVLR